MSCLEWEWEWSVVLAGRWHCDAGQCSRGYSGCTGMEARGGESTPFPKDPRQTGQQSKHVLHMFNTYTTLFLEDWRGHYEQMHVHSDGITAALSETKGYLDKLHQEIAKTLEKISSREKYINNQVCVDGATCEYLLYITSVCLSAAGSSHPGFPQVPGPPCRGQGEVHSGEWRSDTFGQRTGTGVRGTRGSKGRDGPARNQHDRCSTTCQDQTSTNKAKGRKHTDGGPPWSGEYECGYMIRCKHTCIHTHTYTHTYKVEHTLLEANLKSKTAIKQQMNKTADNIM